MTIDAQTLVSRKQQWAKPTKPHEERCSWCGARISVSPTTGVEYGHLGGCARRPDDFPADWATVPGERGDAAQEVLSDAV